MPERRRAPTVNRVQSFLDSQRGLASFYAAEGKQIAAAWSGQCRGDSLPESPILVPRAMAAKDDEYRATPRPPPNECVKPPRQPSYSERRSPSPKRITRSKITSPRLIVSRTPGDTWSKEVDRDLISDDESGRSKRLEQRRNRRRAKRAVMAEVEVSISEMSSFEGDAGRPKKKRKNNTTTKSKRGKATPALLLMQTFSGQNMGKSRLTIKPSASVGVFNKGKASAKVSTKSTRAHKLDSGIVFSESMFLRKAPSIRSENGGSTDDSTDSEKHSSHSLKERVRRSKAPATSSLSNMTASDQKPVDDKAQSNPPWLTGSMREESPVWDVEISSNRPLSRKSSGSTFPPSPNPKASVVEVKGYSWSSKLRKPELSIVPDREVAPLIPYNSPDRQQTTSSYFRPNKVQEVLSNFSPLPPNEGSNLGSDTVDICCPAYTQDNRFAPFGSDRDMGYMETLSLPDTHIDYTYSLHSVAAPCDSLTSRMKFATRQLPYEDDSGHTSIPFGEWKLQELEYNLAPAWPPEVTQAPANMDLPNGDEPLHEYPALACGDTFGGFSGDQESFSEAHSYNCDTRESCYRFPSGTSYQQVFYDNFNKQYDQAAEYGLDQQSTNTTGEGNTWWEIGEEYNPLNEEVECSLGDPKFGDAQPLGAASEETKPKLVRIITENSLKNDLIKNISTHWSTAHRLY